MRYEKVHTDYHKVKDKLTRAFIALRKQGLIARQNYLCCGGCASYAIASKVDKDDSLNPTGCVFYHQQDNNYLKRTGKVYLKYGNIECHKRGTIGLDDRVVGKMICEAVEDAGLKFSWSGDPLTTIEVFA